MKQEKTIVKEEWIIDYIDKNGVVSILDAEFVDRYIEKFNPAHILQPYGAHTCRELGRMLSSLYKQFRLNRYKMSIHEMGDTYPNWVYMYDFN